MRLPGKVAIVTCQTLIVDAGLYASG